MIPASRVASLISSSSSSSGMASDNGGSSSLPFADLWLMVPMPHQLLPFPFDEYVARYVLLKDVENADAYMVAAIVLLVTLVIYQIRAFSRPPPVPRKVLPIRPVLSVLFHPEDDYQQQQTQQQSSHQQPSDKVRGNTNRAKRSNKNGTPPGRVGWRLFPGRTNMQRAKKSGGRGLAGGNVGSVDEKDGGLPSGPPPQRQRVRRARSESNEFVDWHDDDDLINDDDEDEYGGGYRVKVDDDDDYDYDYENGTEEETPTAANGSGDAASGAAASSATSPPPTMPSFLNDLPDSFAPLLSSSSMEILTHELVASQLLHALQVDATVRLRQGRHELPLDKDATRPQLGLDVPITSGRGGSGGGVKLSASASIGSDQLSAMEDFDVKYPTRMRSQPMVKKASLTLDPPLPLVNVAPTLVHFPTLFEDKTSLPTLRRLPAVRLLMDVVVSLSSFLERCLWIVESKCQIHLSQIRLVPLYKGPRQHPKEQSSQPPMPAATARDRHASTQAGATVPPMGDGGGTTRHPPSPDWRLQLSFSGHVLLFGWIPIPFINVTLPTWIIPQVRRTPRRSIVCLKLVHAPRAPPSDSLPPLVF
jgi:hypothetical protein